MRSSVYVQTVDMHNWLMHYFQGREHSNQAASMHVLPDCENKCIYNSRLWVRPASDLHPKQRRNVMARFADDT